MSTERVELSEVHRPPYDGSPPCICCPVEVRSLHAVAHNAAGAFEAATAGTGSWERCGRKMGELRRAVDSFQPLMDAHFADEMHSHGRIPFVTADEAQGIVETVIEREQDHL